MGWSVGRIAAALGTGGLSELAGSNMWDSKKSTVTQQEMMPDWQLATGKTYNDWINKYLPSYIPGQAYTGQRVAPMTGLESSGLSLLDKYLNSTGTGDMFNLAKTNVADTLSGKFADPATSPYIKAMTKLSGLNLQDTLNQVNASRGAKNYFHTQTGQQLTDAGTRSQATLDAILGDYINQERNRQQNYIPLAQQLEQYENNTLPLAKVAASQSFGGLQRTIDNANFEAAYQDYLRQQNQLSAIPQMAQSMYSTQVPYGIKSVTTERPSTAAAMLGEIIPIVGSYNTQKYGYDVGQSSMGGAMNALMNILAMGGGGMGGGGGTAGANTSMMNTSQLANQFPNLYRQY